LSQHEQAQTLIVTGTNTLRQAINDRVHELLGLKGQGKNYSLLTRHDTKSPQIGCLVTHAHG